MNIPTILFLLAFPLIIAYLLYLAFLYGKNSNSDKEQIIPTPLVLLKQAKEKIQEFHSSDSTGVYIPTDEDLYKQELIKQAQEDQKIAEELNKIV